MSKKTVLKKASKKAAPETKEPKLSFAQQALLSEQSKKFNPDASKQDCIDDLRKLQEAEPLKSITRNYYRHHGHYSDATWNQYFGTFHEFRRQAGLELNRDQHSLERKIAKHASLDLYRDFYDAEVLPYHNKYALKEDNTGRWKTVLVGSDFHDIECDPFMLSVFIDTAHRLQPDVICLNGDVWDLYDFSRFDIDPREIKTKERFDYVKTHILGALRRACPNTQIDLIVGNHEARLLKVLANRTPNVRILLSDVMGLSLADAFGLDEFEVNLICKLDLAAFTNPDINNEVKENFKVYYNSFVASHFKSMKFGLSGTSGHTHHPHQSTFCNIPMGKLTWTTTGCMAFTRMGYTEGMDDAMQSFAVFHIDTHTKSVAPEHFIVPGDHVLIHGKRYVRKK